MPAPTLNYVTCSAAGAHRMAYWQWGEPAAAHAIVCVHGLTRQGRDFDTLAQALLARAGGGLRIVCPDVVGRGRSDWLADPLGYQVPVYVQDMLALLGQLQREAPVGQLDWVGTSMGGLIALGLFGLPDAPLPAPLRRLVLNDVGPALRWPALQRIGTYLGQAGRFATVEEAAQAMWAISTSFGPHSPEQWLALSRPMVRALPEGGFTLHYDPAIAVPFRQLTEEAAARSEATLWQMYDRLRAPTLLLRGADSDLLSREAAQAMAQRGPRARLVEFGGVGHAPTLVAPDQVGPVADFLLSGETASHEEPDGRAG
ncbi:alpha/beta fold hydrolase [Ramlibacter tataouinensis]|nr:alpha/beta hydrolase [Ramlibacter tataouinensis]